MKTKKATERAALGALKKAQESADVIIDKLSSIASILVIGNDHGFHPAIEKQMPKVRAALAELNQRVHEFNAYHNVTTTK